MTYKFAKIQRAHTFGFWRCAVILGALLFPFSLRAMDGYAEYYEDYQQVIYTDTPVNSYYAYPDDPNFVPEHVFLQDPNYDFDQNIENQRMAASAANPNTPLSFAERTTVVCRNFNCTRMDDMITRAFMFNSLTNMFMLNAHSRMHICEADPFTRACLQTGFSFPARVGIANAVIHVSKATVDQVHVSTGMSRATVGMTFEILVNGIAARCAPASMDILVPSNFQTSLASREFSCSMTTGRDTNVSLLINIDYIDLDYGILGGYYSMGFQGPAMGGGGGYALFKFEHVTNNMRANTVTDVAERQYVHDQEIRPGEYRVEPLKR